MLLVRNLTTYTEPNCNNNNYSNNNVDSDENDDDDFTYRPQGPKTLRTIQI